MSKLSENNIKEYIEQRLPNFSWSEIFFEMKKEVDEIVNSKKLVDMVSIHHNFTPIFIYYAIEAKCPLIDFSKILQISNNYEEGLNRFFGNPDCDYDEKNNSHIYNKMHYLFYTKEKEKIFFNKEKMPYIYEIIKNVRQQNLLDFHSSKIDFFLCHVIEENNHIGREIINVITQTPNMWIQEQKEYLSMPMNIIKIIANKSYENDVAKVYKLFKENNEFKTLLEKNIINLTMENEYRTNLSIFKMMSQNEENYFDIFMERVESLKVMLNRKQNIRLTEDILFSIENNVQKTPFKFNIENIKTDRDILDNTPYLMAFQKIIETGQYNLIVGENDSLNNYVEVNQEKIKNHELNDIEFKFDEYDILKSINLKIIKQFLQFSYLSKKLPIKENKFTKQKI